MGKQEFYVFVSILILLFSPFSLAQLSESEARSLFRIRRQLENPPVLSSWNRYTDFCSLPPSPSLTITCTQNRVTELTVIGNKGSPSLASNISPQNFAVSPQSLSSNFSIESLFITLSKLQNLEVLSLVSLGLWGALPAKISLLSSLRVLNASSNFIYGNIPSQISSLSNLRSLVLHHNLVDGIVPDLSSLIELEELDLSNNFLGPKFPSLGNKLVIVVLRNNTFRSNIPSQLQYFDQLQKLDLSFNKLIGPIPSPLFSLPAIEYLNLAGNGLSGTLPLNISCNGELGFVDLSRNLLFGRLPLCIRSNSSNRAVLYSWNCLSPVDSVDQHPYAFCHKEALAAFIPDNGNKSKSKLSLVLGIGGAIVGGFAILGIIMCVIYKKMRGKKAKNVLFHRTLAQKASISFSPRLVADGRNMSLGVRLGALVLPPYHIFTLEELEEATNNFDPSNLIREGSKGQIYKGWLRDGSAAVVRCLNLKQKYSPQSLKQLIELLSKLRHRHLVSVLGHCIDSETLLLVSEYVSNGTLRSHLTEETNEEMLGWTHRVTAAISVARGIQFLHTGMVPGIFGSDLRIENILLDENLTAKVNGYRLPLLTRDKVESESPFNAGGTVESGSVECGEKEDIYQLGAILLEVITGKRITSQSELNALKLKIERSLKGDSNKLRGVTDPTMSGTFAYDSVRTAVEVAVNCLSKDLRKRPSIEDVLWNLQYSIQVQDGWANSGNLSMHS